MVLPPAPPVITQSFDYLYSNYSIGNQWYRNGILIPGATGQSYLATQNGLYWDVVTRYGMQTGKSNEINVIVTGFEGPMKGSITVYPVPGDGLFYISIDDPSINNITCTIYNQVGAVINKVSRFKSTDHYSQTIDLRPISQGIYTLIIRTDNQQLVRKLVVRW